MAINHRSLFGKPNPYDNHLPPASDAPGGTNALDQSLSAATADGDQGSTDSLDRRQAQADAFKEAQRVASGIADQGAPGVALGRGPDTFWRAGAIATDGGTGDVVAPEGDNLHLRADGGDSGVDGTGRTVG